MTTLRDLLADACYLIGALCVAGAVLLMLARKGDKP